MATLHLLHGFVGSGKTTFARQLEQDLGAVRFTPDEWMRTLYGADPPAEHFQAYLENCLELIWRLSARLIALNVDVILDFGFWTRASRDEARRKAHALGAAVKLYHLACADSEMRRRVLARTAALPEGALSINAAAIDSFRQRFEPLAEDEACIRVET